MEEWKRKLKRYNFGFGLRVKVKGGLRNQGKDHGNQHTVEIKCEGLGLLRFRVGLFVGLGHVKKQLFGRSERRISACKCEGLLSEGVA